MARKDRPTLQFYYDVTCPFAYMGSLRVEALARRTDAELIWTPVLLGAIYRETAAPQGAAGSASDVFNPTKKRLTSRAMRRTLQRLGVEIAWPSVHPRSPVLALRLLHHVPAAQRPALTHALFRAYWVDDRDITDKAVLLDVARRSGIASASRLTESVFDDRDAQDALRAATAEVVARGAPGVPAFWVAEETWVDGGGNGAAGNGTLRHGRLYWGQDRMHFVEAALHAVRRGCDYAQVPDLPSLQPRCVQGPPVGQKRVEFWYDFSSPWAFLGWTQLDRLKRQFGPDVEIVMKPFLLGALFKAVGARTSPWRPFRRPKEITCAKTWATGSAIGTASTSNAGLTINPSSSTGPASSRSARPRPCAARSWIRISSLCSSARAGSATSTFPTTRSWPGTSQRRAAMPRPC
ncbi:DSBA-like thioredoxin domain-containing protein [Cladophialophora immunda]|nr:DSBA-like thioredoxin domain-containing protein [Cladophialophora immunda]